MMSGIDFEVVIAGAGPAGVACALQLVRSDPGLRDRVLLLDRARFPRDKPCGGALTGRIDDIVPRLGLSLRTPRIDAPHAVVRIDGQDRWVKLPRPVHIVRRLEFDADLLQQASTQGVSIRPADPLIDFSAEPRALRIRTRAGTLRARVLVGADGVGSLVRRRLRTESRRRAMRLFRLELSGRSPFGEAMLYDFSPMACGLRGYVWIFPVTDGRLNVGLLHHQNTRLDGRALCRLLEEHLRPHGIELPRSAVGWPAWCYTATARLSAPHVLLIGDAAGIDALTGEGIAVAMEQGIFAANTIRDALFTGDFGFRDYARKLRRITCGRELAVDDWAARLLYGRAHRIGLQLARDPNLQEIFAERISGERVLADHKAQLVWALAKGIGQVKLSEIVG